MDALHWFIQIIIGLLYVNLLEWTVHKYLLHGLGKNKKSIFAFHWKDHHRVVRKHNFKDPDYFGSIVSSFKSKEVIILFILALLHLPLVFIFPVLYFTLCLGMLLYYGLHRYAHTNPVWAKKYLRWHYDHHCGKNQDSNWCVTFPLWDYVLGTRRHKD
jgi:sterol desaturase/sphingolipid hydroxylase (fatty acid hydroxylase superfamily)